MKKQIILSTIVLGALVGGTYAMYGQGHWNWQGHGMWHGFGKTLTAEQRENYNLCQWKKEELMFKN